MLPELSGYPYWARRPQPCPVEPGRPTLGDRLRSARARHGHACRMCGTPITDPKSVARGVGPECWKKISGD